MDRTSNAVAVAAPERVRSVVPDDVAAERDRLDAVVTSLLTDARAARPLECACCGSAVVVTRWTAPMPDDAAGEIACGDCGQCLGWAC